MIVELFRHLMVFEHEFCSTLTPETYWAMNKIVVESKNKTLEK